MNVWAKFKELTEAKITQVGEVLSYVGNNSKIEDSHGNIFIVIGTSVSIGDNALVEDGVIVGTVPSLTEYTEWV